MDRQTFALIILGIVLVMNVIAFALMGADKRRARRGQWRISENTLFIAAACFGGLGGVLGMRVFHHKTQHWYFRVFFPVLMLVQIALLIAGAVWLFR